MHLGVWESAQTSKFTILSMTRFIFAMPLQMLYVCSSMGGSCSTVVLSDDDSEIPPRDMRRHAQCTVRAARQLMILNKKQVCDCCRIMRKVRRQTRY